MAGAHGRTKSLSPRARGAQAGQPGVGLRADELQHRLLVGIDRDRALPLAADDVDRLGQGVDRLAAGQSRSADAGDAVPERARVDLPIIAGSRSGTLITLGATVMLRVCTATAASSVHASK